MPNKSKPLCQPSKTVNHYDDKLNALVILLFESKYKNEVVIYIYEVASHDKVKVIHLDKTRKIIH